MVFACKEVLERSSWPAERAACQSPTASGQNTGGRCRFRGCTRDGVRMADTRQFAGGDAGLASAGAITKQKGRSKAVVDPGFKLSRVGQWLFRLEPAGQIASESPPDQPRD